MPRSRGGAAPARAPARPSVAPPRPAPGPTLQQRSMSTAPAQQAPPAQASRSPGLFGQMASTAAGVAVGSSIGHAIGGFFGGGSSAAAPAEQEYQQPADNYAQNNGLYTANAAQQTEATGPCANDIKSFQTCMNQNNGDLSVCGWYLDQLRACQAAARNY